MPRQDFRFSFPFRVRYAEVDQQGIVFNAHYLTYFDTAITEYFRWLEYDYIGQPARTGTDFHVVRSLVEYSSPIRFDEEIDTLVRVGRIGRSSLTLLLEIHGKDREDPRATGEIVWVNTDRTTRRSTPVPPDLTERLAAMGEAN